MKKGEPKKFINLQVKEKREKGHKVKKHLNHSPLNHLKNPFNKKRNCKLL
jgi:hypothetical protein